MTLIACKNLDVTLGACLFKDLTISLSKGDRLGLVAANGRGKSTFLRCLIGAQEATAGEVTRARGIHIEYVEQDIPVAHLTLPLREAVLRAFPSEQHDIEGWRVDILLDDLEVPEDLRNRPLLALSGGWQRTALLARACITGPDILLMDEPTNHLDLGRIGFLQNWLATSARSVSLVVASHDRAFLDAVTTRTLFLREMRSQVFALPYSRARAALAESDANEERRFENDMKQAAQLRRQAAKLKNIGINSGSDLLVVKTKQLQERATRLEEAARPAHQERSAGVIRLANGGTPSKALVAFDDVAITAPDGRLLFKTGQLWINKGDRVVLLGCNGSGKSRLMSVLHRALQESIPGINSAPTVVEGWSDQNLGQLDNFPTPWAAVTTCFDLSDERARALLAGAGIGMNLQSARISALSGGQRARLAMLMLRLTQPNLYLLDEPTNHLDIEGQEALEDELREQGASALLVSHDRAFVRGVGSRFWHIQGRRLVEVDGPEEYFAEALRR